jgi:hypothetical protein
LAFADDLVDLWNLLAVTALAGSAPATSVAIVTAAVSTTAARAASAAPGTAIIASH